MADDFVEENGGGGGDIEGVGLAKHGNSDEFVGLRHPRIAEAKLFGTDDNSDGLGHVDFGVVLGGVGTGGKGTNALFLEPGEGFGGGGFGDGNGEEGADAGAYDVGVVDVSAAVAHDEGMGPGGVGGAKHGAEVAGLFNVLADDEEGDGGKCEVGKGAVDLGAQGEESFRAIAIGDFHEDGIGAFEEGDIVFGATGDEGGFVFALVEGGAIEELENGNVVVECAFHFSIAFDDEETVVIAVGALAQFDDFFDAFILKAGDELGGGRHGGKGPQFSISNNQHPISNDQGGLHPLMISTIFFVGRGR